MKISWAKRTIALVGSIIVSAAAINSVSDQAVADSNPIANWSLDTTLVPAGTGGNVNLTFEDPELSSARYVIVDKITFDGRRHQTIDTGIVVRDNLPAAGGAEFRVEATAKQVDSGYLFSTSGVFPSEGSVQVLFPRWGLFYGLSPVHWTPTDENRSGTRTVFSTAKSSEFPASVTQNNIALNLTGVISASISNPTGSSFTEKRSITPPGQGTSEQSTTNIGQKTSVLGDGTLLIAGVGGNCLVSTTPANCKSFWDQDAGFRESTDKTQHYRSSMFHGDITSFKAYGNPGTTSDTNDVLLFNGIPAYDQLTGFCGLYDTVSSTFKTAEDATLLKCGQPPIAVESTSGDPKMVFTHIEDLGQCSAPVVSPCMKSTMIGDTVILRLALPPLPDGWAAGSHPFRMTIILGDNVTKTIDFTLYYVDGTTPPGELSIDKRAWKDVPHNTEYADIIGNFEELPDGAVIPADTNITFTYTVLYEVASDEGDYTGRPGLTDVTVTDGGALVCTIDLTVNVAEGCVRQRLDT